MELRMRTLAALLAVLTGAAAGRAAEAEDAEAPAAAPEEYPVRITRVQADASGQAYSVQLEADGLPEALRGKASFAMVIGESEGGAILRAQRGVQPPRPMTHDLLASTITALGGKLERVTITKLERGTYHAEVLVARGEEKVALDARPSDSMALAVRADAPIFVRAGVLEAAGEDPAAPAAPEPRYL